MRTTRALVLVLVLASCAPAPPDRPRGNGEPEDDAGAPAQMDTRRPPPTVDMAAPMAMDQAAPSLDTAKDAAPADVPADLATDLAAPMDMARPEVAVDTRPVDAAPAPTFMQLYTMYFGVTASSTRIGCKGSKCHDTEASNSEKISFATAKACFDILTGRSYVVPEDADSQLLYLLEMGVMPKDPNAKMKPADVEKVKAWIMAGAKFN